MKLIDTQKIPSIYGFTLTRLIIDHPNEGRILLTDGYGGENTLSGGAVRWEHGAAYKLLPGDTFESLESLPEHNECTTALEAIVYSLSIERPLLPWDGERVARFAQRV